MKTVLSTAALGVALATAAMGVALALAGCAAPPASRALDDPRTSGKTLAEQVCANCHGQRGLSSSENFPNLAAQPAPYVAGQLHSLHDQHRRDPAGFVYMWGIARTLTDTQIEQLAAYYAAQPAAAAAPARAGAGERGRQLFTEGDNAAGLPACMSCHGGAGEGQGAIPRLAHQQRGYVVRQLRVLSQGPDGRPLGMVMNGVAHQLTEADMTALADYVASM